MSAVRGPYRPFPTFMHAGLRMEHEEQLLGVGLPVQPREAAASSA